MNAGAGGAPSSNGGAPPLDVTGRLAEAEDMLRAIAAGEIDAFVVAGPSGEPRVFALSTADRPYRMFVENMREGAATVSADGTVLFANDRLAELVGMPRVALIGAPLAAVMPPGTLPPPDGMIAEGWLVDHAGRRVPVLIGTSRLDMDDQPLSCLTFTDLTSQKAQEGEISRLGIAQAERLADLQAAQAALVEQATHDPLTGLPNRALLVDRLDQALLHARRSGWCTAVFFVDLDRFKQINDSAGHAAGDEVLRRVARRLVDAVRPMDTVCRLGGDEFVVLTPEIEHRARADDIARRLVADICRPLGPGETGAPVTASVGVSVALRGTGTAEVLLGEADAAMYRAKSFGGGRTRAFDADLGKSVRRRTAAQRTLQTALDEDRVLVHYQPMVDLAGGRVAGFEALARIRASDGTIVPPGDFIPAAEHNGLIVPLGTRILEMACVEAVGWEPDQGHAPPTVAVNISARQFDAGDLVPLVRAILGRTGLAPERLQLELTETVIIELRSDVLRQLERIAALGVQIGLDDFGTGYASLTHLSRLPLSFVKIDQSFVQGLVVAERDERIVAAVVDLASNLDLRSVAEGVETAEQLAQLRALGCDLGQGYLFARPAPSGAIPAVRAHPAW